MTQFPSNDLFKNIGLSLSGGGYRASGFHLGLLVYLNRINLLSQVKMLSTVSGGTFTGAKYALSLVEQKTFKEFYEEFYDFLDNTKLVELALDKLGKKESSIPSQRADLITAVAQVYADFFLEKSQSKPYRFGDILNADISLQEVIFNSTEFRYGLAFRFQRSFKSNARIGNGEISIPKTEAADIRIADIVAASSCFPGGFEPLAFPEDFNWSNSDTLKKVRSIVYKDSSEEIALMDGGIYDNQGVESLWLADKRNGYSLDLLIISDVDQQVDSLYQFPSLIKISNLSLKWVDWISKIAILLCLFTFGAIGYEAWKDLSSGQFIWLDIFLYIVPLLLAIGATSILLWGRNIIKNRLLSKIPQVGEFAWDNLKQLTISQVVNGIYLRLTSLQAMAGSVFMKRVRRMVLRFIYQQYKGENRKKLIFNQIYDLKKGSDLDKVAEVQKPSTKLLEVIDQAANMATTLWFTEDNQLDNLIICGQATICYKLMLSITRIYGEDPSSFPDEIQHFWASLLVDWNSFCSEPQVLH